jgi:hypothetical protein
MIAPRPSVPSRDNVHTDLENLMRGTTDPVLLNQALEAIELVATPSARVTVAMSHHFLAKVGHDVKQRIPSARIVVGSGPNGADLALLTALAESNLRQGDRVVLLSGDGIFAEPVASLAARGVMTMVLAHRDCLAGRLRMAAHAHLYLDSLVGVTDTLTAA